VAIEARRKGEGRGGKKWSIVTVKKGLYGAHSNVLEEKKRKEGNMPVPPLLLLRGEKEMIGPRGGAGLLLLRSSRIENGEKREGKK